MKHNQDLLAHCPECDSKVHIKGKPKLGQLVICKACDTELEIVDTAPLELDWAFSDGRDDDDRMSDMQTDYENYAYND